MNAHILRNTATKGLLAAALICFASFGAFAQDLTAEETAALKNYEAAINSADPVAAKKFLKEASLTDKLTLTEPDHASDLIAKARAITDLEQLLDKTWRAGQDMELSRSLALRIDFNTPLEKVGIGAAPETLLPWMEKYEKYSDAKTLTVKKAIRQFETVFGTSTVNGKARWEASSIRERNAMLSENAAGSLEHLINSETRTDKAFQNQVRNADIFNYLDSAGRARYERYLNQLATAEAAKTGFSMPQIDKIKDQPIEQQMYLLGSLFDNNKNKSSAAIERKVDSGRQSKPGETLSFQNNQLMAGMLQTSMVGTVKGTAAGDKVLKFYNSGAKLNVAIESCQGCYAKYEPSTGKLIMDSEMIQQYMRVNGITAETLVKDKAQVAALAEYVSPMFVHEATHQMQHDWADRARIYKPYVQEDEIESSSMEALYTTENMKKDKEFKGLFMQMEKNTAYAQKRVETMDRFNEGSSKFDKMVRQVSYYGTPSFDAASSRILSAISSELERRKTLSAADRVSLEKSGTGLNAAMGMTAQELSVSVADINTDALKKIQGDLLSKAAYTSHYESASDWTGSMLGAVRAANASKNGSISPL